jgi:hypothetical protein
MTVAVAVCLLHPALFVLRFLVLVASAHMFLMVAQPKNRNVMQRSYFGFLASLWRRYGEFILGKTRVGLELVMLIWSRC